MILSIDEIEKRVNDSYELPNQVLKVMPKPMVTVKTLTYQHARYIKDCIEGVLMQKTTFPVEYIIGEDFSTDGTREIVFEYAQKYPEKIRVITADYNVGAKPNGKRCERASRGKYMALCEGDDYWIDPLKLQLQVDYLEANPDCSLCFHASIDSFSDSPEKGFVRRPKKIPKDSKFDIENLILGGGGFMATNSMMYPIKYIIEKPDWIKMASVGDFPLMLLLGLKGRTGYIDREMSVYRVNIENSWSNSFTTAEDYREHYNNSMLWLNAFNQVTGYKYNKSIEKRNRIDFISYIKAQALFNKQLALKLLIKNCFKMNIMDFAVILDRLIPITPKYVKNKLKTQLSGFSRTMKKLHNYLK